MKMEAPVKNFQLVQEWALYPNKDQSYKHINAPDDVKVKKNLEPHAITLNLTQEGETWNLSVTHQTGQVYTISLKS
jgi:hypothetical protein